MAFATLFLIALSVVLVVGSVLIWRSKLPERDKMISCIGILSLFCLVSIFNEARRSSTGEVRVSVGDFEKVWQHPTHNELAPDYKLPVLEDSRQFILNSFPNKWNPEDSKSSYQFAFLYSEARVGKTFAAQKYNEYLQKKSIPSFYINIKHPNTDPTQLALQLRISTLSDIDDVVEKSNRNGQVPVIFVDNIQNAFVKETPGFPCQVCAFFKSLYDSRKVNIIFISSDARAREALQTSNAYNNRMNFFEFAERNHSVVLDYLQQKINPLIAKEEKRFIAENTQLLLNTIGWSFEFLDEYITNIESYDGIQDFISKYTKKHAKNIANSPSFDLLKCLFKIGENNSYVNYGIIRKSCGGNPSKKIDEALDE